MGTAYRVQLRSHRGALLHTFEPENLKFSLNLNAPHDISWELSFDDPYMRVKDDPIPTGYTGEGDPIGAYQHDWHLFRNGKQIPEMAGMVTNLTIGEGQDFITVQGKSWLHYLSRRHYPYNPDPAHFSLVDKMVPFQHFDKDVTFIIHNMLSTVLARDYSLDIDISELSGMTTFNDNFEIDFGDTEDILSKISTLAEGKPPNCFDFSIGADKVFHLYHPEFDPDIDAVWWLEKAQPDVLHKRSSPLVHQGTNWTDNGPQGTHIVGQGTFASVGNDELDVNGDASSPRGWAMGSVDGQQIFRRLDFTMDFGQCASAKRIRRLTEGALMAGVRPQREVPMQIVPNRIENFWNKFRPGAYYNATIPLGGGHRITGTKKILSMECEVDNEGNELVTLHDIPWTNWFNVESVESQL